MDTIYLNSAENKDISIYLKFIPKEKVLINKKKNINC